MKLIEVLREDHEALRQLAGETTSAPSPEARREALDALLRRFRAHAGAEEKIFYPWLGRVPAYRTEGDAAAALHAGLAERLEGLATRGPEAQSWDEALGAVLEDLERHLSFEEALLFGALEGVITEEQARALADQVRAYEQTSAQMADWERERGKGR